MNKVKVTYLKQLNNLTCCLTDKQMKHYGIKSDISKIMLKFGCMKVSLKLIIIEDTESNNNRIYLSQDLKEYMHVDEGTILQIKGNSDEELELGPFIGVFINQEKFDNLISGKGITAYTQFHNTCRKLCGLCCFFSIENIDWNKKIVKGLIKKSSGWTEYIFPLPRIIYDRNVENNCRIESIELRKRLNGICQILNPMAKLAKWETIKAIEKNPELVSIIPKTIQYRQPIDLENSLKLYPRLYLKPDSLSKGKGIFRVSKNQNKKYRVEYRTPEENHIVSLEDLKDLEVLMGNYQEKGGSYIIQQEIDKAVFRGNPFDFRALFQKNFEGVWELSGVAVRIAAKESIITSPRSGGAVEDLETVLKEVFNESLTTPNGLYENIVRLGREVCLSLEKEFGDCVELGLDMTIDADGKIWIIEANGKPLKVSLKRLDKPEIVVRCNKRPIEYAVKLSGFASEDTHG